MDDYDIMYYFTVGMMWFIAIGIAVCAEEAHLIAKREKHERQES